MNIATVDPDEFAALERSVQAIELVLKHTNVGALEWATEYLEARRDTAVLSRKELDAHPFMAIMRVAASPVFGNLPSETPTAYFEAHALSRQYPARESAKFARSIIFMRWQEFGAAP